MLQTTLGPDGHAITNPSRIQYRAQHQELAALLQQKIRACEAIALEPTALKAEQAYIAAWDLLAVSSECLVRSRHLLASSRESLRGGQPPRR